jgi:dipeptidyl aminopeptidase/acylaminoacyl peptidase
MHRVPIVVLLLVLGGCGGGDPSLPGAGGEAAGRAGIPAALAEGSRIFFVSTRDGNQEVYAMRGDGSGPTNLTNHPADDCCPSVSADGSRIAFLRRVGGIDRVLVMAGDGSGVTDLDVPGGANTVPSLSPDGRWVAVGGEIEGVRPVLIATDGSTGILRMPGPFEAGGEPPVFSPDSASVVYLSDDGFFLQPIGPSHVFQGGLFGGRDLAGEVEPPVRLVGIHYSFSPDGTRLLFVGPVCPIERCAPLPSAGDLHVVNLDGSGLRALMETRRPESQPAWSPDGTKIAFVRTATGVEGYPDEGAEVYVLDLASGREVNVSNHEADDTGPVWSPDGQWLAFTSDRDDDEEVYAVRADGSGLTRLTNSPGLDRVAAWRPGPGAARTVVFSTSDSPFTPGARNQGWWNPLVDNSDGNDNYVVGFVPGSEPDQRGEYRNFFTFDLSSLTGRVISARLELTRFGYGSADPSETLGLFDVSTGARTLNRNNGASAAIFEDLGTGTSYGTFEVSGSAEPSDVLSLPLNAAALADINAAAGGFFSMGGRLLSAEAHQSLFGDSNEGGVQRLVVETVPAGGAAASP